MRSKKLLRQLKKNFGSEDFENEMRNLYEVLKSGQPIPDVPAFVEKLEHIHHFLDTVDNSYSQNETMLELANRSLEVSTKELYQANEQFRMLNMAISAMVNSLDEGFLVIDKSGRCGSVISKAAVRFLGREPKGEHLSEILNIKDEEKESFTEWMTMLFNEVIPFEDLIELAPKQLDTGHVEHKIEIKLKPIRSIESNSITDIVVILVDISERAEAERKLGEQKLFTDMVIKYLNNKSNFVRILQMSRETALSMKSWVYNENSWKETYRTLLRELHTLKGGANTFSMYQLGYKLHQIEDELHTFGKINENISENTELIRALGADLLETLNEFMEKNKRIFNFQENAAQSLKEIPTNNIYRFCAELLKNGLTDLLKYYVDQIVIVPFVSMFAPIEANIYSQSMNMDKPVDLIYVDPFKVKVIPEFYTSLFEQMVHIFNNIMDHAIEPQEERLAYEKNPMSKITIELGIEENFKEKSHGWLNLSISDDGRGINPALIREKLNEKNIQHTHENDEEVIYHIFDHGFSTRKHANMTSGRGVGMGSVLAAINQMGGSIKVKSVVGKGTTFIIRVPYVKEINQSMTEWINNVTTPQSAAS